MTDENLIEALLREFENDHDYDPEYNYRPDAERYAAVFEKARPSLSLSDVSVSDEVTGSDAPTVAEGTTDERRALESIIDNATMFPSDDIERAADAILAAGFRRVS